MNEYSMAAAVQDFMELPISDQDKILQESLGVSVYNSGYQRIQGHINLLVEFTPVTPARAGQVTDFKVQLSSVGLLSQTRRISFRRFIQEFVVPRFAESSSNVGIVEYAQPLHPDILRVADDTGVRASRLTRKNNGEMVCLRLETGMDPACPFIVTSMADAPSSKLGYRTLEDAEAAATDYVREYGRPFFVMRIVARLGKKPAPVEVQSWTEVKNG